MNLTAFILIILLSAYRLSALPKKPKLRAFFESVECPSYYPDLVDITCHINRTANAENGIYTDFMFKQRITNLQLTINVNITFENRIWQNYASKTIDVCEALNGIQDQYILQMVFMQIRRKSNIPWECPIKEHIQYYIEGVAIDTSVLPQFLPHIRFKANSDFYFNKLKMLSFKSQGQVFRN